MGLPRTFVSFSSSDIGSYHMMCAWKAQENIDFNFYDLQLEQAIDSANEQYIKRVCRAKLNRAGTYILLIGSDTQFKNDLRQMGGGGRHRERMPPDRGQLEPLACS